MKLLAGTDAHMLWVKLIHLSLLYDGVGFNNYAAHAIAVPSAAMFVKNYVDSQEKGE